MKLRVFDEEQEEQQQQELQRQEQERDSFLENLERCSPSKGNVSLDDSVSFVCGALKRFGIDLSGQVQMDARVCDALYMLLQMQEENERYKSKLQVEVQESRQVVQLERKQVKAIKDELQAKDKQLKSLENKTTLKDETLKAKLDRSRNLADDLNKRVKASESKINIMQHLIDKKEREYEKLQDQLQGYMDDKKRRRHQADQVRVVCQERTNKRTNEQINERTD